MSASGSKKVILLALLANGGIAIAKFVASALTGSAAMLAEAVHSCADTANQVLLLLGMHRAQRAPNESHPFGYARETFFWSFVVAVMLFSLGGLFSIYEAIHKWHEILNAEGKHEPGGHYMVAMIVLVFSIVLEAISWKAANNEINRRRGKVPLFDYIKISKAPEIIVVWLEDTGALLGLICALIGVGMTMITGNAMWDALGSGAIGILLIVIAFVVGREIKSLLIGEAALPATRQQITEIVNSTEGVEELLNLLTLQMGEHQIMVAMKVRWQTSLTSIELIERINRLEVAIKAAVPEVHWLFVEPDSVF